MKLTASIRKTLSDLLALAAPILIIFLLPSLGIIKNNVESLGSDLSSAALVAGVGVVMFLVGGSAAIFRRAHPLADGAFLTLLLLAPLWLVYSGLSRYFGKEFLFPAMLFGAGIGGFLISRSDRLKLPLCKGFGVFSAGLLLLVAADLVSIAHAADTLSHREELQTQTVSPALGSGEDEAADSPSVYHIVFDEFQTEMFEAVLTEELKDELGGFTFFPNATTPYGRTDMALGCTFSGRPYDFTGEPWDYMYDAFNSDHSMITSFENRGYSTFGLIHKVYPSGAKKSPFQETRIHKEYADLAYNRGNDELLLSLWLVAGFPRYVVEWLIPASHLRDLDAQTVLPQVNQLRSVLSFRRFLQQEVAKIDKRSRYVFAHLIVPHFPYVLDENCAMEDGVGTSPKAQSMCAARLAVELIETLKKNGRFTDSLILIQGDHGASYLYEQGELIEQEHGLAWHQARSRPLLLIKPAGVNDVESLKVDERSTDLFDIYPTVLSQIGAEIPQELSGASLFLPPRADRPRYYHFYTKDVNLRKVVSGNTIARYKVVDGHLEFDRDVEIDR